MKLIFGNRQSGRTTDLIELWIKDPNGFLVVHNEGEKSRIISELNKVGKLVDRRDWKSIITYNQYINDDFLRGYADWQKPVLYIDNGLELMRKIISDSGQANYYEFGAMSILGECSKCKSTSKNI